MNKINLYDKILSPVVTEKSTNQSEMNKVVAFSVMAGEIIISKEFIFFI